MCVFVCGEGNFFRRVLGRWGMLIIFREILNLKEVAREGRGNKGEIYNVVM